MLLRRLFSTLVVAGAVCGPVMYFSASQWWTDVKKAVAAKFASGPSVPTQGAAGSAEPAGLDSTQVPVLEGPLVRDLAEVLRFDVSTGWVMSRWPRVSTGLGQLELQGYRVPLVTGTAEDDLAGVLTYYFNSAQQVQQITFYGTTGNAVKLLQLLSTRFHFTRRVANDPSLFLYEVPADRGEPKSVLTVRPSAILKANQPNRRFEVALVVDRPEE